VLTNSPEAHRLTFILHSGGEDKSFFNQLRQELNLAEGPVDFHKLAMLHWLYDINFTAWGLSWLRRDCRRSTVPARALSQDLSRLATSR